MENGKWKHCPARAVATNPIQAFLTRYKTLDLAQCFIHAAAHLLTKRKRGLGKARAFKLAEKKPR